MIVRVLQRPRHCQQCCCCCCYWWLLVASDSAQASPAAQRWRQPRYAESRADTVRMLQQVEGQKDAKAGKAVQVELDRIVDHSFTESELLGHSRRHSVCSHMCKAVLNFVPPLGVAQAGPSPSVGREAMKLSDAP